ncbi:MULTISPECIES: endonuclease/exonuclease/phosphatase family protein [Pseudomonas]|jgi:endonuclease/exonuclease/phosphatase family metal-dependent hydrolase|uniref:Endonuclease/exonuclease/phosphatase family protein n=4 Tax=Pseudomonas TaxID=286 RepID=A0A9X8EM69_PSEPU|nr:MULTISPECIES: endonuclease/exonuclease/phosphatase family protein [Pseudomonas]MCO7507118.1 endonuclease/exonuclease/phosphatase family protein [Pseudomonas sp. VE 267-6A]MCO7532822.1 endonuclease/exonuclease/phosphatase family protein [Pseudomonas sp. 2]MCP8349927.1 endonuclease [Pseudomonas sp. FBF18]QVL20847.1 endonuclease/exonuclease/phosphatase family protein [Pseudomonas qingdaonensis]ROQ56191.1 endonuclease/exonuclease/phosphatase family protein [Pseudomonas putida]
MPVDRVIGLYIDNNLVPDMPAVAFEEQVDVVFMDAVALLAAARPRDCVHTLVYLNYIVSARLIRSSNHEAQAGYGACMTTLLRRWYSDTTVLQHLQASPGLYRHGVMIGLYRVHHALVMNGLRSVQGPHLLDPGDPLRMLQHGVMAIFGPWHAHIRLHGRIRDYYHSRLNTAGPSAQIEIGRSARTEVPIRVATWNLQGASVSTESKWLTGVLPLLRSNDVVVLQEVGVAPHSAVFSRTERVADQFGSHHDIHVYSWQAGTRSRPERYLIYFLDVQRLRVNLAIVMPDPGEFMVSQLAIISDGQLPVAGPPLYRPAMGVRVRRRALAGNTPELAIFNLHAISGGGVNAARMLREISWHTDTPFALLGDFNRDPRPTTPPVPTRGNWVSPEDIARIELAGGSTHPSVAPSNMLDYAVTNGTSQVPAPGNVSAPGASDHRSVHYNLTFNC